MNICGICKEAEQGWREMNLEARMREIYEAMDYEDGEWDMFKLITSVYYGKQYYFLQDNELVYSRASGKYMTFQQAVDEFLKEVGE